MNSNVTTEDGNDGTMFPETIPSKACLRRNGQVTGFEAQVDSAERRLKLLLRRRYADGYAARLKNWIWWLSGLMYPSENTCLGPHVFANDYYCLMARDLNPIEYAHAWHTKRKSQPGGLAYLRFLLNSFVHGSTHRWQFNSLIWIY